VVFPLWLEAAPLKRKKANKLFGPDRRSQGHNATDIAPE